MTTLKVFDKLMRAHINEAEAKGAEFTNCGWATTSHGVLSKTTKGMLNSELLPNGEITHEWM